MSDFQETLRTWQNAVESYLSSQFCQNVPYQRLLESMRYSLLAGGKRLRPILCLAFCQAVGGDPLTAIPAAAAVEMVHTYSLIHDDLPCMDNDDYRRGKLTNHKVYGEDLATLAGDALLTAAFGYLARMELPADRAIHCVKILSEAAGECGMVAGQVLDLEGESRSLDERELRQVHACKTGCMIRAACQMGVLIGGGDQRQIDAAGAFAMHLGLAFQIRDDMLDDISTEEELGKPIGSDRENGKTTFMTLYDLEGCQELVEEETRQALECLHNGGFLHTVFVEKLSDSMVSRRN